MLLHYARMIPKYCEVALAVPLRKTFTFAVPAALAERELVGSRVVAPFRRRAMVGVVLSVTDRAPEIENIREIVEVLDAMPALSARLIELGKWITSYYLCPVGDAFRAMLPPVVEVEQKLAYSLTEAGGERLRGLSAGLQSAAGGENEVAELAVLQMFETGETPGQSLALPEAGARHPEGQAIPASRLRKLPGAEAALARLLRRGDVIAREVSQHRHARVQKILSWNPDAERSGKAAEERVREILIARGPLPLAVLAEQTGVSRPVVTRLERENKLASWEEPLAAHAGEGEGDWEAGFVAPAHVLNAEQQRALDTVRGWMDARIFITGLLHGVTGSGKTEVYLGAIAAALEQGRTALVLVPEIALTLWVSRLVRARFGAVVAILHSGLPEVERAREWWRVRRGEARVVVGTRSAVFAPLENVAVVIVDEEQESSYKQEESPRYNGRDTAIMRAKLESAVALLGSATPSLESYQHARAGKYHLIELRMRVQDRPLATVKIADLREDFRRSGRATPISAELRAGIAARLADGTQTMVLINRRGYSWFLTCRSCGLTVMCENCSITLTYHKRRERLECHYCGFWRRAPKTCPKCESKYLYFVGDGAERVEEYLREQFPQVRLARLDRDTVRTKREYETVLGAFARGELDVLVGTQMVAKGHDFERVTLVGVVAADLALGRPDFRAAERTFQLLTQVAGRAGRGRLPGEVIVESYHPEHYAIQEAVRQNYLAFFEKEAHFRRMLHYPPFAALANIVVRDRKIENAIRWSRALQTYFAPHERQDLKVLGPAAAPLSRLRQEFRFQFLLKTPKRSLLTRALSGVLDYCAKHDIPGRAVIVDVDPASLA